MHSVAGGRAPHHGGEVEGVAGAEPVEVGCPGEARDGPAGQHRQGVDRRRPVVKSALVATGTLTGWGPGMPLV